MDQSVNRGYLLLVLAVFSLSLMSPAAKALPGAFGPPQILLVRSLFMFIFFGLWAWKRGAPVFGRHYPGLLWLRGIVGTAGFLLFVGALQRLTLADTILIFQTHPIFVALFGPWILKETNRPVQWLLMCISIGGVALVVGPTGGGSMAGRLMALGCAVASGIAYSLVRLTTRKESVLTVLLSFPMASILVVVPLMLVKCPGFSWHAPAPAEWLLLAAVGVCSSVGQMFLTLGLRRVPAARGTPIFNLQVVLAMIYGYLFFAETPGTVTILGSILIVTSLILLSRTGERIEKGDTRPGRRLRLY
jgi:drug/metabolite transporter (DMT)-like permease